jgi:hypothetical protein
MPSNFIDELFEDTVLTAALVGCSMRIILNSELRGSVLFGICLETISRVSVGVHYVYCIRTVLRSSLIT